MEFLFDFICKDVVNNKVLPFLTIIELVNISSINKKQYKTKNIVCDELIKQYNKFVLRTRINLFTSLKVLYNLLYGENDSTYNYSNSSYIQQINIALEDLKMLNNITYERIAETFIIKYTKGEFITYYFHDKKLNIELILNTHRNKLNGISCGFHLNNKLCSVINFISNELSGKIQYFDKDNKIIYDGSYSHNLKNGHFISFQEDNKIVSKYIHDKLIEKTVYDTCGKVLSTYILYNNQIREIKYNNGDVIYTKQITPDKYSNNNKISEEKYFINNMITKKIESSVWVSISNGITQDFVTNTHITLYYNNNLEKSVDNYIIFYDKGETAKKYTKELGIQNYNKYKYFYSYPYSHLSCPFTNHRIKQLNGCIFDIDGSYIKKLNF